MAIVQSSKILKNTSPVPYVNLTENVWREIKFRLGKYNFTNIENFKWELRKEYDNIPSFFYTKTDSLFPSCY